MLDKVLKTSHARLTAAGRMRLFQKPLLFQSCHIVSDGGTTGIDRILQGFGADRLVSLGKDINNQIQNLILTLRDHGITSNQDSAVD